MSETLWSKNLYRLYLIFIVVMAFSLSLLIIPYIAHLKISEGFAIFLNLMMVPVFIFILYYYRNKAESAFLRYMKVVLEDFTGKPVKASHLSLAFIYQETSYTFSGPNTFFLPYNLWRGGEDFFLINHSLYEKEKYKTLNFSVKSTFLIPKRPTTQAIEKWKEFFIKIMGT